MSTTKRISTLTQGTPGASDSFVFDGTNGTKRVLLPGLEAAIAADFLASPGTFRNATLGVDGKLTSSQVPTPLSSALVFISGIAGSSVPSTATAAGYFYVITSAGTSQTKTWAVGDFAVYNGSSGSWTQVSPGVTSVALGGTGATTAAGARLNLDTLSYSEAAGRDAAMPHGGVVLNGTAASYIVSPSQNFGTGDFSLWRRFRVPSANPSASVYVFSLRANNNASLATGDVTCFVYTDGRLYLKLEGATPGVDQSNYYLPSFVSLYAGQVIDLFITRTGATLTFYINGTAVTFTGPTTIGGGATWSNAINTSYVFDGHWGTSGAGTYTSGIYRAIPFNFCASASDVLEILAGGLPQKWKWGSTTALIGTGINNGDFTSFSAGVPVGWSVANYTCTDLGPGCRITAGAGYTDNFNSRFTSPFTGATSRAYRVTTVAKLTAGSGNLVGSFAQSSSTDAFTHTLTGSYTTNIAVVTTTGTPAALAFRISGGATGSAVDIQSIKVEALGAVQDIDLTVGIGYQFHDRSSNKLHGVGTQTGWAHKLPASRGKIISVDLTADGTLIGFSGTTLPANAVLESAVAVRKSGSGTTTGFYLSSISGGAAITNPVDVGATAVLLPITNSNPGGTSAQELFGKATSWASNTIKVTATFLTFES